VLDFACGQFRGGRYCIRRFLCENELENSRLEDPERDGRITLRCILGRLMELAQNLVEKEGYSGVGHSVDRFILTILYQL